MDKDELLKIYSAYLPYKLKINDPKSPIERELTHKGYWHRSSEDDTVYVGVDEAIDYNLKPILYDLSYLTKEIEHEGERFVPTRWLRGNHAEFDISKADMEQLISMFIHIFRSPESAPYYFIKKLLEWHFNVFGLPEDQFINKATLKS